MTDEAAIRERDAQDWRVLESAFAGAAREMTPLPLASMSDRHALLALLDAERAETARLRAERAESDRVWMAARNVLTDLTAGVPPHGRLAEDMAELRAALNPAPASEP
jgi:hypothetical protein